MSTNDDILWLHDLTNEDVPLVGGKNASLGEMIGTLRDKGIDVPAGFAVTASAYRRFLEHNDLVGRIEELLGEVESDGRAVGEAAAAIRELISGGEYPPEMAQAICDAYDELGNRDDVSVAVRSSATAEDLPKASFAGQQETYLNVQGDEELLEAVRDCFASLFTERAMTYREHHGFDHMKVYLSVGVQLMARADQGAAGVAFTIDTETGFPDTVVITGSWGLGENVVKGEVNPDEYRVFKPLLDDESLAPILDKQLGDKAIKMVYEADGRGTRNVETTAEERATFVLTDDQILQLGRWCKRIEEHYGRPMDIEWALDGVTGELAIVQARPETVHSQKKGASLRSYTLNERSEVVSQGVAVGSAIATGKAIVLESLEQADQFETGAILIAPSTDPDWMPIMKRAAAIVTDRGGRTSHAAIVSRELGLTAIVGTGDATRTIETGDLITVSCAEGVTGRIYRGLLDYDEKTIEFGELPETDTRIMMNVADPQAAMRWWQLPAQGVGLARVEFIIENHVQIHPMALVHFEKVDEPEARDKIEALTRGWDSKPQYFVDRLAEGVATIAAARYPQPVIVRMSDFKTNEYAELVGGHGFEFSEANPMIGFRGASRYYNERYRDGFQLECAAIRKVREAMGLDNVLVMIPFCRTLEEADRVLETMAEAGLERGEPGLQVYVMAEIPSNIWLADGFAERFDGFSIGSNDLTQLTLGVDRDSGELAHLFDERNAAVTRAIAQLIETAHAKGRPVGICGQGPSDHPDFAEWLVAQGIDSISLNPDSIVATLPRIAEAEERRR